MLELFGRDSEVCRVSRFIALSLIVLGPAALARAELTIAPIDSLAMPPGTVTGITWVGPDVLAVLTTDADSAATTGSQATFLVVQDSSGRVLARQDVTGTLARGLAYDGEYYWSCGDDAEGGSLIYQVDAATLEVLQSFPLPGHRPVDCCYDGHWVWVSDRDSARIDRVDPEKGQVTRSVTAPAFSPYGLTYDGSAIWTTDSATGRMYRLSGARLATSATVDAASFLMRGRDVLLAYDGQNLYFLPIGGRFAIRVGIF